ncbi:MAG: hypothetical protein Q7T17_16895 [Microbacterium sp.]|uniref:hypothetical protein n=1 Tax=Microbacterium sp. TaxID=51671 RepID=UPI002719B0FB|nr:hypothetical protein [Microbacterium sp.]MDO8384639.1 hypothetical protein [Microbacterium sp.]
MSDQTPPTDAPPAGDYPSPPTTPPAAPPFAQPGAAPVTPPVASPVAPPYPNPPYAGGPYPGPQHPSLPDANAGYPPAGMYPGTYPAAGAPAAGPTAKKPGGLGLVALLLALGAAVVTPIIGAVAAFQVGTGISSRFETMPSTAWEDLSFLSPVREWVLLGEIAFWAGTVLGIWAIVQGIVAIAKRRGLGTGIAAVVVAAVGLFIFGTVVYGAGLAGIATGATGAGIGV